MKISQLVVAAFALSFFGCATPYREPEAGAQNANLVYSVRDGPSGALTGLRTHKFWVAPSPNCKEAMLLASGVMDGDEKRRLVPAERALFLHDRYEQFSFEKTTCDSYVSFVPRSGATYEVRPGFDGWRCAISVVDLATGQSPKLTDFKSKGVCLM